MLKLKLNTSSEQNTNFNFNMAQHMSRGDYYHDGVNRPSYMRGGATREERGIAAEMREMHPKVSNNNNSNFLRVSNQFHSLLNQVVHDKNTLPFAIPGAMDLIISVFERQRWKNFARADTPTAGELEHTPANIARIAEKMPNMVLTAYPTGPATAPFDVQGRMDELRRGLLTIDRRDWIELIPAEVHRELYKLALDDNIIVPDNMTNEQANGAAFRLLREVEKVKQERILRESAPYEISSMSMAPGDGDPRLGFE